MEKSVVSIVKGTNLDDMGEKSLGYFGGVEALIKKNSTVVIKPNSGHMGGPDTSANTSPEVEAAVIKAIQKANPKKLILAESAAMGCKTRTASKSAESMRQPLRPAPRQHEQHRGKRRLICDACSHRGRHPGDPQILAGR